MTSIAGIPRFEVAASVDIFGVFLEFLDFLRIIPNFYRI